MISKLTPACMSNLSYIKSNYMTQPQQTPTFGKIPNKMIPNSEICVPLNVADPLGNLKDLYLSIKKPEEDSSQHILCLNFKNPDGDCGYSKIIEGSIEDIKSKLNNRNFKKQIQEKINNMSLKYAEES